MAELAVIASVWPAALVSESASLRYHVVAMMGANALVGFFAV